MDIEQLAGTRLGNYEIENLLGRCGMGVAYGALQLLLDRHVLLEILSSVFSPDPSCFEQLQREAHAVEKPRHSNIVQTADISLELGSLARRALIAKSAE